jgi:CRISPR-associated endoribonuclease Cas6
MYQLLLRLQATRDCAWERQYHRNIRGRLGQTLQRADIDDYRESQRPPFTFSDLIPVRDDHAPGTSLNAGDGVHLLIAAPRLDVMEAIADGLQHEPELTAGSMVFETRAAKPLETGVDAPGSKGVLTTTSGVVVTVEQPSENDHGATPTYWTNREHSPDAFKTALHRTAGHVIDHEAGRDRPEQRLFDEYEHRKTYGVRVDVTPVETITLIASKWDLHYEVRDDAHRAALNELLARGVGAKRSYGFGMLQTRADTEARGVRA